LPRLRRRGKTALRPPPRVFLDHHLESSRRLVVQRDRAGREDLLGEWDDPAKGPQDVTRGWSEKVWWKCGKDGCGHRWGATVGDRV